MKGNRRFIAWTLSLALLMGMIPQFQICAKGGVSLSAKKITIVKGKTKTLTVKNAKGKVGWKVTSGKKFISIKKSGAKSVKITGKVKGNAKVQATVGKKKLVCKVVIKDVPQDTVKATPGPNETKQPTATADKNSNITTYSADKKSAAITVDAENIKIKDGRRLLFTMENTGKEQIERLNFKIVLKDQAGKVVETLDSSENAIAPGETVLYSWYYEDVEGDEIDITKTVFFKNTWQEDDQKYVNVSSEFDISVTPDASGRRINVSIKDNTGKGDSVSRSFYFVFYDADGKVLSVDTLWDYEEQGETITGYIDINIDGIIPEQINYKYFVHAYTWVHD